MHRLLALVLGSNILDLSRSYRGSIYPPFCLLRLDDAGAPVRRGSHRNADIGTPSSVTCDKVRKVKYGALRTQRC